MIITKEELLSRIAGADAAIEQHSQQVILQQGARSAYASLLEAIEKVPPPSADGKKK